MSYWEWWVGKKRYFKILCIYWGVCAFAVGIVNTDIPHYVVKYTIFYRLVIFNLIFSSFLLLACLIKNLVDNYNNYKAIK